MHGGNSGGDAVLKIKIYDNAGKVTEVSFAPLFTNVIRNNANIHPDKIAEIRRILEDRK